MRLVLNGEHAHSDALREAVNAIRASGIVVDVDICREAGDAVRLAAQATENGADAIVCVGGDGTLNEVINGVYAASKSFDCGIGIVPNGTANDFATYQGIPSDNPRAALDIVVAGAARHLDVGRVNGELFANVASGGFGAEVVGDTPPALKKVVGKLAYVLTGLASAGSLEAREIRVTGEDFEWSGKAFSINVGNSAQAGGGFKVCPRAKMDDGLLDLLIVPDMPLRNAVQLYDSMRNGGLDSSDLVMYHQSPWFLVESPDGMYVNLDGESRFGNSFQFDLLPRAMPLYLPAEVPAVSAPVE
jgi:lipid kinase YegS